MVIRTAGVGDRAQALDLLAAQLDEHAIPLAHARLAHAVDGVLGTPERGVILLAGDADAAVGVAYLSYTWALEHGGKVAWLEELYVRPEHRGRGVGGALLEAACAAARAAGCAAIDLEVDARHERAAHLYLRRGFRRLDRTRYVLPLSA